MSEKITIEKLDNAEEGVLEKLENTFERRSIDTFLTQHSGFTPLTQEEKKTLLDDASLESVARHIDAVNRNLEGTTRNMNEFSSRIRENPVLLLRGQSPPDEGDAAQR